MRNISIKTKILLLTIVPLLIVSVLIIFFAIYQAKQLGSKNIDSFSSKIFELRRTELKNYTDIAVTAVSHLTKNYPISDEEASEEVKQIIRNMRYGTDGYFYAYEEYITKAHPTVQSLEGNDQREMVDLNGTKIIQELYKKAKAGGGFTSYVYLKPSRNREVEKIGYSDMLDGWGWWIGTGLYVDDLEDAIELLEQDVDENINNTTQLIILLALGAVVLVGLVGAKITLTEGKLADAKLRDLSRKSTEAQEEERTKVARQLQSSVLQSLNFSKGMLKQYFNEEQIQSKQHRTDFLKAVKSLHKAIDEIQGISGELRPEMLDKMGLDAALQDYLQNQRDKHPQVEVGYKFINLSSRLSPDIEIVVYRIIQMALSNVYEHANATSADIRVSVQYDRVIFSIQDNGSGFNVKNTMRSGKKAGIGLIDMQVRTEALGGRFSIFSYNKVGTHIKVDIPR